MTISDRVEAVYKLAEEMGLAIRIQGEEGKEDEEPKYKNFTKIDARTIVDAEDARNEEALLKRETIKTSYGTVKTHKRAARMARNPRDKQAPPFEVPAKEIVKVDINSAFNKKLNPHLPEKEDK